MKRSLTTAKAKSIIGLLALCALAAMVLPVNTYAATMPSEVLEEIAQNYPNGLPAYMTPEEQAWLDQQEEIGALAAPEIGPLAAPSGTIWTPGEYEPLDGVLVAWEGYTSLLTEFVVEVSQSDTNAKAYVVVDTTTERTSVTTTLTNAGANMSNVEFLVRATDSVWIRDYGPRHFYEDSSRVIMNHNYNRPRPNDDAFPPWLGTYWSETVYDLYDLNLEHGGGNFHVFSDGSAFMSTLIDEENSENQAEIIQIFKDYHDVNVTIYQRLPSTIDATGHIDMWLVPLSDTDILVSEFASGDGKTITDAGAADLEARGYTVWRTPAWNSGGTHYTYTNSAIVNNKVFIPWYSGYNTENAQALAVYQAAMPDHEIIPIDCSSIISAAGAIHCVMKHVYAPTIAVDLIISGYILESDLTPIEGVSVDANNGGGSDTTDSAGYYEVLVPENWSGTVTPTKADYTFTPTSRSYTDVNDDIADQNYTATYAPDLSPPVPSPMTWASVPTAISSTEITMTATTATDDTPPVEYYFECTNYGDANSSWQTNTTYVATGLSPETLYTFKVKARDSAPAQNETSWSSAESATTPAQPPITVYDFTGITSPSGSHTAEDGEIGVGDLVIENGTFPARRDSIAGWNLWAEATTAEYAALVSSDDSHYQGADPGYGDNAAMIFEFYVSENPADVTQIDVSVEIGRASPVDFGWAYIWNYNTSSYLVLGFQSGTADEVVSASVTTNPGDYVEPSTGQLTVFVVNEDTSDWIRVDDISVTIYTQAAPPKYTLTTSSTAGGSVTTPGEPGPFDYNDGQVVPIVATADAYYHFVEWTGDISTIADPCSENTNITMNANYAIVANFAIDTHTVTFIEGADGSITGTLVQVVAHGSDCTEVDAVADPNYHFVDWTGDYTGTSTPLTITNVTADMTITANFAIDTHTVTFIEGADGSITGTLVQVVAHGSDCTEVDAVADPNYHFVDWTGDYTGTDDPLTITNVTADMTITANFAIDTHTVTFIEGADGSITGTLVQVVAHGSDCTEVDAVADPNYHFDGWTGDYTGTVDPLTITNVTADMTITANFAIDTHTVTFIEGADGSITGTLVQVVNHGSDCTEVDAVADPNYHFVDWTGDYTGTDDPLTITNVTADMTITANFAIDTHTVTFIEGADGSITGTLVQVVNHGSDCTEVNAVADPNYHFDGWTGDYSGMVNPLTITNVTADMTITANFAIDTHTVTFIEGADGSITGTLVQVVNHGSDCTEVNAVADPNYHFDGWTGDYSGMVNPLTITNVTADMTITANFAIDTHTVTFIEGADGSITGTLVQVVAHGSDCTEVDAVADPNYHFVDWTGDYTGTSTPLTITNVTADMTITANFAIDTHTVTFIEGADGSITGTLVQVVNHGSDCTEVNAVADPNYHFDGWTGDYSGMVNPLTITNVTADMTITANFAIDTHTVTFIEGADGSITGTLVQVVAHGSDCTEVDAVADPNYHFVDWTGDYTGTSTPLTITNVTADMTITANFAIDTHTVTFIEGADGSITGTLVQVVAHGSDCTEVDAVADPNYHFVDWTGDYTGTSTPLTITNVTADMTITANFAIDTHTVTFIEGADGSITGTLVQVVAHGSDCTEVDAVADPNYHFVDWTGDYTGTSTPLTITNVTADMTITANFAIDTHTVTFIEGADGSITGTLVQVVAHGSDCTEVDAVADPNYHFVDWTGDYTGTDDPLTITNVTADMTITANFAIDTHTVTFIEGADGSITGTLVQVVAHGSDCTEVDAVADPNYHFVDWTGDYTGTDDPLTITNVTADMTITANFAIDTHTVTFIEGADGSITGTLVQVVNHGSDCTEVDAVADPNYHFVDWTGDYTGTSTPLTITNVTADMTITANFAIDTHTVTFIEGADGSITGTLVQVVNHGSDCTEVNAVADPNYHFVDWTGDYTGTSTPLTITNVTADMTITANFAIDTHTVTFIEGADGSITGTLVQVVAHGSDCTEVDAVADPNYHFVDWTGDYTGTSTPLTITNVTADMTITANFAIDTHTVTFIEGADGSITGTLVQVVAHGSDCTEVDAVADPNYHFVDWTGDYTGTDDPLTITNVTADMTITANFAIDTHTVTFIEGADGSITGTLVQVVAHGSDCTEVDAVADPNYHFVDWTGDYTGTDDPLTITNVTADMTITANFAIDTHTVTFIEGADGSITGTLVQVVNHGSDCTEVDAVADPNYHFVDWTGDYTGTSTPLTITNVTADMTITANFAIDTHTVTFIEGADGSITGTLVQVVNHGSDCTEVNAVADPNYHFVDWTGDYTGTNTPLTITNVTADMTITANFAIDTHTVTFIEGADGSITGTLVQVVAHGSDCTEVDAVADPNHHFVDWTGDYTGTDDPLTITNVTADMTITANFAIDTHTVTFIEGADGSITGTLVQVVAHGSDCTEVDAVADPNYHFVDWTGDYTGTSTPLTITNVTADMTITANFAIDTHTVTFIEGADGSITGTLVQVVAHGSDCTEVDAVADPNYHFDGWTGDYTGTDDPLTITNVTADMTITANFAIDTHTVTFIEGADGSITGTLVQVVAHGSDCTEVDAVADPNYHFVDWTGDYTGTDDPLTITNVTADMTITANFAIDTHTVTFIEGADGSITGTLVQVVAHGSDCTEVDAVAYPNYHFVDWTGDYTGTDDPLTITNVTADMTITANFAIDTHTLTYNAGANGSISGTTPQTVDHGSDGTAVTAVPDTGHHFVDWLDASTDNPRTDLAVTGDITVTANFALNLALDNFDDNRRGVMWQLSEDDHENVWVLEDANRLNLRAMGKLFTGAVGYWKMDDNEPNTVVIDSSGNSNHGTAQQNTEDLHIDSGNPPNLNGALTFNGTSDYVDVGNVIGTGAYTKVAWIKRVNGTFEYNGIVGSDTTSNILWAPRFQSFKLAAGHNNDWDIVTDSVGLDADVWYQVAVSFDPDVNSGQMVLYKNGVPIDSATSVPTQGSSTATFIGKYDGTYYFWGAIDNVAIFDRAITPEDMTALYNGGDGTETLPVMSNPLAAVYVANDWSIDVTEDFEVEIDFHYSVLSERDGWAGMNIENDGGYVSISVGSDSNEAYYYYEKVVDGNAVFQQQLRGSDDGTLYISYDAGVDELYLSFTGYGSGNAWQTVPGLLAGQWLSEPVSVVIGGGSDSGAALGSGEAYLDNFEVASAALLGWPIPVDLDYDGLLGWGDIDVLSDNWLEVYPDRGDINGDDIANFLDFAEIAFAWQNW